MDTKCSLCKKESELHCCSGCGLVYYCTSECQKEDWKNHKPNCKTFIVKKIENKGFGMVAARTLNQGDLVLAENPVLLLPKEESARRARNLQLQFEKLIKSKQNQILSLHDDNPSGDENSKLRRIFESNAIDVNNAQSAALYTNIPRINHSCSPNVIWGYGKNNPLSKEVRALKKISKGDEILANYIDSWQASFLSHIHRQKVLERWNFVCQCRVCSLPADKLEENDGIRQKIFIQHSLIPKYMSSWNVAKAVEAAKMKLKLSIQIEEEILSSLPSTLLETYELLRIAEVMGGQSENTKPYLEKARKLSTAYGYSFLQGFNEKVQSIENQCLEIASRKAR